MTQQPLTATSPPPSVSQSTVSARATLALSLHNAHIPHFIFKRQPCNNTSASAHRLLILDLKTWVGQINVYNQLLVVDQYVKPLTVTVALITTHL